MFEHVCVRCNTRTYLFVYVRRKTLEASSQVHYLNFLSFAKDEKSNIRHRQCVYRGKTLNIEINSIFQLITRKLNE